jgi:hypothetical protein
MPGLNKWRTLDLTNRAIQARKVTPETIKQRARKVLELVQKCAKGAPEVCLFLFFTNMAALLTLHYRYSTEMVWSVP